MASSVLHANTFILQHLGRFDWISADMDTVVEGSASTGAGEWRSVALALQDSVAIFGQATVALIEHFGWPKEEHYRKYIELLATLADVVDPGRAESPLAD